MLSELHKSDLFKRMWVRMLKAEAKTKLTVTFSDVVVRVWKPVFQQCCRLLEGVRSCDIQLRDVDHFFRQYEGSGVISEHLHSLHAGVTACDTQTAVEPVWIHNSIGLMEQYWALCGQATAAKTILNLKKKLHLTGGFDVIEYVASQVTESMQEAPLSSIHRLTDAKSFLEEMTAEKWKVQCLQEFADSLSIVEWIRKETTGKFSA
jgi:hypothetical protein